MTLTPQQYSGPAAVQLLSTHGISETLFMAGLIMFYMAGAPIWFPYDPTPANGTGRSRCRQREKRHQFTVGRAAHVVPPQLAALHPIDASPNKLSLRVRARRLHTAAAALLARGARAAAAATRPRLDKHASPSAVLDHSFKLADDGCGAWHPRMCRLQLVGC